MLYLGMDGGGTACRAAVADAQGRIVGRGEAGSANIWSDPEGAAASIVAAAGGALAAAGAGRPGAGEVRAVLGLAGANMPGAAAALAARLPFRARIETDALVAIKGALGGADGIAAVLGTGSVFGVQRDGEMRTLGGWGFLLGDQGSGARIARALLEKAILVHDGVRPGSPLVASILGEFGGAAEIVAFAQPAAPGDFARLAPRVIAAADAGDAVGAEIMEAAEADVAAAIDTLMAEGALPVTFLGGLGSVFARRLADRYAGLVRPPQGSGLDGALLLARAAIR